MKGMTVQITYDMPGVEDITEALLRLAEFTDRDKQHELGVRLVRIKHGVYEVRERKPIEEVHPIGDVPRYGDGGC
jgi:hypothetical protein